MSFASKLDILIEERGLNNLRLSNELGIGDRLIGAWRKGEKRPTLDNFVLLGEFFGVSLDYLADRTEVREMSIKKEPAPEISENGQELLEIYNQLPEREQLLLLGRLQERYAPVLDTASAEPPAHNAEAV